MGFSYSGTPAASAFAWSQAGATSSGLDAEVKEAEEEVSEHDPNEEEANNRVAANGSRLDLHMEHMPDSALQSARGGRRSP